MDYFNVIRFLAYGLVAGVLAKTLFPGDDKGGLLMTSVLGVLGSISGGWVFNLFGWSYAKGFSLQGLIPATCGAFFLLIAYKFLSSFIKNKISK